MGYFDEKADEKAGGEGVDAAADAQRQDRSELNKILFCNVPITSQHVSRLLVINQMFRLGLVEWDPLSDYRFVRRVWAVSGIEGGEGRDYGDAGHTEARWAAAWEDWNPEGLALLEALRGLEVYTISLRLLDRFERVALVRMAELVEDNRRKRLALKRRWTNRRNHEKARWRVAARKRKEKRLMKKAEQEKAKLEAVDGQAEVPGKMAPKETEVPVKLDVAAEGIKVVIEPSPLERPEIELEIVRVGPNPRVLQCQYKLLADTIKINVWVKKNANFKRGMKLVMAEQPGAEWKWEGVLPRHPGRW